MSQFGNPSANGDDSGFETRTVRPYAVTGGRVRSDTSDLPLEALVEINAEVTASRGLPPEKRAILQHASQGYISVIELSALIKLPLGVVRILVADLAEERYLRVHSATPVNSQTGHGQNPGLSLSVLESVLNGISAL